MSYKKHIPEKFRKLYKKRMKRAFWRILKGKRRFSKMYKNSYTLYMMGPVEKNLHLDPDHLYWHYNCSEKNYLDCTFGDEGFRKRHKFDYGKLNAQIEKSGKLKRRARRELKKQARKWWMRNPNYNENHKIGMEFGGKFKVKKVIVNTPSSEKPTKFRNKTIWGEQAVILVSESGIETFRYSRTKPILKIGKRTLMFNIMRGADVDEWVYKNRLFWVKL
jgi:hypothetical protein